MLFRELELAGAPYDGLSICTMVASVIAHVGNEMQRRVCCPKLLAGESLIALGYSEPDSGSDVAAARTRAVRDGDGWRIDGQKIFTSLAEESEWVFLLTRTDPDVAKHQGLTFFLVPTSAPGFELQPIRTLSGKRTNTTFYDGVHVDDEWRVGEVDGGWQVMLVALSFERGVAGGVRDAERLLTRRRGARAYRDARRRLVAARRSRPAARPRAARDRLRGRRPARGARGRGWRRRAGSRGSRARRRKLFATEALHPRRRPPARRQRSGRPGAVARRHRPRRVLRVLLPLRTGHHHLRRHQRDPAQPRRPTRARPAALALRGATGARAPRPAASRPTSPRSGPRCASSSPTRWPRARTAGHEDRTRSHRLGRGVRTGGAARRRATPASWA